MFTWTRLAKFTVLVTIFFSFSQQAFASSLICKSQSVWLKKWYGLEYIQLDTGKGTARFGANDFWLDPKNTSVQNIAIGAKYAWRQTLTVTNSQFKGREYTFDFSLRIKSNGEADLFARRSGSSWELPMLCK